MAITNTRPVVYNLSMRDVDDYIRTVRTPRIYDDVTYVHAPLLRTGGTSAPDPVPTTGQIWPRGR